MSHLMQEKRFASKVSNPWWANGENYIYKDVTNNSLFELSKCDFEVTLHSVKDRHGDDIKNHFYLENNDNGAILRLSKGRFTPIQPKDFFDKIDKLGDIESICGIGKGEKIIFNLLGKQFNIGEGNTHNSNISCLLPLDGTKKPTIGLNDKRVECNNTFVQWYGNLANETTFTAKQTKSCSAKIDNFVSTFLELQEKQTSLHNTFKNLANIEFSPDKQMTLISSFFDDKESATSINKMRQVAEILKNNATTSKVPAAQKGTGYELFNAVTFYTNHASSLKKNTDREESLLFGSSQSFAEKSLNLILDMEPTKIRNENLVRSITL